MLDAAKGDKPVSIKKAPISAGIIDKFAGSSANLEDMRVTCICSLDLQGFFVMTFIAKVIMLTV